MNLNGQVDQYGEATKEVVRRKPDIIIATGPENALMSAIAATDTLPIVMIAVDYDPFARGYVQSLARPGGTVTGIFFQFFTTTRMPLPQRDLVFRRVLDLT